MGVTTSSTVAATYEPIATQTLGSTTASITFGSGGTITQAYTDLIVVMNTKGDTGTQNVYTQFNSDTNTNYSMTYVYGTGSSAASSRNTSEIFAFCGRTSDTVWTNSIFQIQNYSNTSTYKTFIYRGNDTNSITIAGVSLWRSTSAINSIKIYPSSGNWATNSTFTLYGIKAA